MDTESVWSYLFPTRKKQQEAAYRSHYLATDLTQTFVVLVITFLFLSALTALDFISAAIKPSPHIRR